MILSTDMAKHTMLMARIADGLKEDEFNPMAGEEGTNLVLQIALKCADISNQARPWKVANQWNEAVYSEFYHEGTSSSRATRLDRSPRRAGGSSGV